MTPAELNQKPVDIFAEGDASPESAASGALEIPGANAAAQTGGVKSSLRLQFNARVLIIPLVIVVLGGLVYLNFPRVKNFVSQIILSKKTETPVTQEKNQPMTPASPMPAPASNVTNAVIDSDGDGLTDQEELSLDTNPNQADTDGDGLYDYEEVKVYKTDPLKKDSDSDGIADGDEVKRGEDPLDPTPGAKLLDLQKEINKF